MSVNGVTSNQVSAAYSYSATENVKADTKAAETTASKDTSKAERERLPTRVLYMSLQLYCCETYLHA